MNKNKKGQVWTLDFVIGLIIFLALLGLSFFIIRGSFNEKDTYTETVRDSDHVAAMLLGESDSNGTILNLNSVKIAENNRINDTKLKNFSDINYNRTKILFQISGDYVFYFYNGTMINYNNSCFRGYNLTPDCTLNIPLTANNIAKTERIVILNSSIVKMIVISWN